MALYPAAGELPGESGWHEDLEADELADVLRSTMREEYADASDEEMGDALENVLDSMSQAEAFNFGSALNQIGKSASRLASDPAFTQVLRTAAPIVGGAAGTALGGPLGAAVGSKLGTIAASALPARAAPSPGAAAPAVRPAPGAAAPSPGIPTPPGIAFPAATEPLAVTPVTGAAAMPPPEIPAAPKPASSVAGGSAAAAQALVLCQQSDVLLCLLATAFGQYGRQQVSGLPAAQVINLFSHVLGQAAADADELMYLGQQADAAENVLEDAPAGSVRSLYTDLLGADNLELAEATEWDGLDR